MPKPPENHFRIHRFCDLIGFHFGSTETLYMSPTMAREVSRLFETYANDIEQVPRSYDSPLGTMEVNSHDE